MEAILNSFLTFLDDGVSKESGKSCAISCIIVCVISDSFDEFGSKILLSVLKEDRLCDCDAIFLNLGITCLIV